MGIVKGNHSFPLIVATAEGLELIHNEFLVGEVTSEFSPALQINWEHVPLQFVPINSESQVWEVAELVMPYILEFMHTREPRIENDQICTLMCRTWGSMGSTGKSQMQAKVRQVFQEAAQNEFAEYLRFSSANNGSLRIVANPLDLESRKITAGFRKLAKAQESLLNRLKGGQIELKLS